MVGRRTVLAAAVGVAGGLLTSACGSDKPKRTASEAAADGASPVAAAPAALTVNPTSGATDIAVNSTVEVTVEGGTLQTVAVSANGKTVAGQLDAEQRTWRSTGELGYGLTYTVDAAVVDGQGTVTQQTSTFTTVKPAGLAAVAFQANALAALKTGGTYGVGQVVSVHFSKAIKDKDAAVRVMTVQTSPSVEGRWRWIDSQTAHWRPASYWKPGTKITVDVKVFGVNLGNGVYGSANASTNFTIGPSKIAIADANTHRMQVFIDGKLAKDMPVSLGKGGTKKTADGKTANFWTASGPHVVLERQQEVRMTSSSFGITDPKDPEYYDSKITYCCRISYSGEYVHLADWNIPAHGKQNTSHGCINVGPDNAKWFYANFGLGDVVDVKNSPRQLELTNGLGDWTISWDKW